MRFVHTRHKSSLEAFHASPDYALWYGWSEMQRDLTEIKELAAEARRVGHVATINVNPVATQAAPPKR